MATYRKEERNHMNPNTSPIPPLHDYQLVAKNFILTHPYCGLFLDMGLGKACDDNTMIPTPSGQLRRLGDIRPGDKVFGKDGKPTTVTAVFHHKNKTAYEVSLRDGRTFICCDEHLIPYYCYNDSDCKKLYCKPLGQMLQDYRIDRGNNLYRYRYRIPLCGPVEYPEVSHAIHPYALGVLLGAGHLNQTSLILLTRDDYVLEKFLKLTGIDPVHMHVIMNGFGRSFTWDYCANKIREELRNLSLNGTKSAERFIPRSYMIDSIENRLELLHGIMDTDGYLKRYGQKNAAYQIYNTSSRSMYCAVTELCHSLGFNIRGRQCGKGQAERYEIIIHSDTPLIHTPAKLPDVPVTQPGIRNAWVSIVNIKPLPPRNMTCLTVDAPDSLFLINDYIVTHNTRITLDALYDLNPPGNVLIIAPPVVARSTWTDEINKWKYPFRCKSLAVNERGKKLTKAKRLKIYDQIRDPNSLPTIYFMSRSLVADAVEYFTKNPPYQWPFPVVIIDESQSFKNYTSTRFKALQSVRPQIYRLIELTGTPEPKGLMDLWPQIYLLDQGARLGKNITIYRNTFFRATLIINNYPVDWEPLPGADDYIHNVIRDLVISMKNTYIQLPPITYNDITVHMDDDEMALYKQLVTDKVLQFDDDNPVIAKNSGVLAARLSQMASGALYIDKQQNFKVIHTKKLEITAHIVHNTGAPVLIAYHFESDKIMLMQHLKKEGIDVRVFDKTVDMIRQWNAGKIQVMLLQPASAGYGLNLQESCSCLVWYTLPWSLEEYLQTIARLHRQGQTRPTIVHRLIAENTIDERIDAALCEKNNNQQALLDAVKCDVEAAKNSPEFQNFITQTVQNYLNNDFPKIV